MGHIERIMDVPAQHRVRPGLCQRRQCRLPPVGLRLAVNMDAVDYLLQDALSVYNDAAQQSGKNYFLTYFGDVGVDAQNLWGYFSLWYDFAASSNYPSTASLSNVAADVDMATVFPLYADDAPAEAVGQRGRPRAVEAHVESRAQKLVDRLGGDRRGAGWYGLAVATATCAKSAVAPD